MDHEAFMEIAWRDFIMWAFGHKGLRAEFEADTGERMLPVLSPIDAMIDAATGRDSEYARKFTIWATKKYWGEDEAPKALRDELATPTFQEGE